jgi:hypothetical protein
MSMRNQPSRALIPRVYPGPSDVRSSLTYLNANLTNA